MCTLLTCGQDGKYEAKVECAWNQGVEEGIRERKLRGILRNVGSLSNVCQQETWESEQ